MASRALIVRTASTARASGVPARGCVASPATGDWLPAAGLACAPGWAATAGELDWAQAARLNRPSARNEGSFIWDPWGRAFAV